MRRRVRHIDPEMINLDRCYAASDRQMEISRRQQALLSAAGEFEPHRRWYVLTVASRAEKIVEKALGDAGIEHWLPSAEVVLRRRAGRAHQSREPVDKLAWPGYIFVKVANTASAWAGLAGVKGVLGVIGTAESPAPVEDEEVDRLKVFLEKDEEAREKLVDALRLGEKVRVTDGPFATFEGLVLWLDDSTRLGVEVSIFGRAVPVELDLAEVEKVA